MTKQELPCDFRVCVQSGEMAVRAALSELMTNLKPLTLDVEEEGTVELVLAEALNNVVEHGYPKENDAGPIAISCSQQDDGLHFEIRDKGLPMPDGQAPIGMAADVSVPMEDMPEGGFGWFLIQDLAKDVKYKRNGDENLLNLRIAVGMA